MTTNGFSLNEPPFRPCCGQQHWGVVCPDGKIMCCLCYERVEKEDLHETEPGVYENVCQVCYDHEDMMLRIRAI